MVAAKLLKVSSHNSPEVNFSNILLEAFTCADPKRAKKSDCLFALLGSAQTHKMLVKLTPGVNFTRAFFVQNFGAKKLQSCNLGSKFFGAKILAKKLTQNVDEITSRYLVVFLVFLVQLLQCEVNFQCNSTEWKNKCNKQLQI